MILRTVTAASLVLLATPALAGTGTLTIEKQGLFPAYAWVDGQPVGKIKKRKPAQMSLDAGWHEVWYAGDDRGILTLCHGLVNVPNGGSISTLYRDRGCEGLSAGWPNGPSAFKGSEVQFRIDDAVDAWVSIDGGPSMALPSMPFMLNLEPGTHTFVLYTDVMEEAVFDQGTVTLAGGQRAAVTCTVAGCVGFDQPPIIIQELRESPSIQLAVPGVSLDLAIGVNAEAGAAGGGASVRMGATATDTGQGGGASVGVSVDDGMGGGVDIQMDVEASETGGSIDVQIDETP